MEPVRPDVGNSPHLFEKTFFQKPAWCHFCSTLMCLKTGYYCKTCKYACHRKCAENVPNMCQMDREGFKKTKNPLYISRAPSSPALLETTGAFNNNKPKKGEKDSSNKGDKDIRKTNSDVGTPYNVHHHTHVDFNFNWSGERDPTQSFEFFEQLGKGAYASVLRARHKETGFPVAIKVLQMQAERKAAFRKEIEVLKTCKSSNILSYYGTVTKGNEVWILMDLCGIGSIKDLMTTTLETLDEEQIQYVVHYALKGLAYLHAMKIIHLDVKAANILLTESGEIKLGDFGVSEQIQRGTMKVTAQDFAGSPLYMAPEVIEKDKYNYKADIWSLGITCIELAEGRPPNTDITNMTQLLSLPQRPPPTLKNIKMWSRSFSDFLSKCLIKDPDVRPDAIDMLKHPFVESPPSKEVLRGLINQCIASKARKAEKEMAERIAV